ncbi:hypothetical protein E3P94_01751 [Wallemia ichthyophaga]|nr:hypothetical protein E3P95_01716 [Wallemia ichthyophaga]TIB01610.1 hypothetical protein E3P94_01751 [Wallemia ichthyophaga]
MAALDADFIRFDGSDGSDEEISGNKRTYEDVEGGVGNSATPATTSTTCTPSKHPKGENGKSRKEIEKQRSKKAPWMADVDWEGCRTAPEMLHREVDAFTRFISPSVIEHKTREYTIECIRRCITSRWSDAHVFAFGSFETRLYLPDGDIDLVVMRKSVNQYNKQSMLHTMASILRQANLAQSIQVISKARVPIIKFQSSFGGYPIDISLNQTNGVDAGRMVNDILDKYPAARPLSILLKCFLAQRSMNEVYTGGVSSYAVICLVVSFLQMHPKVRRGDIDPLNNLGVLIVDLLELYGRNFNYDNTGIAIEGSGYYFSKSSRGWHQYGQPYLLCIQDPQDVGNDISKGSFNILNVRKVIAGAYDMLTNKLYAQASEIDAKKTGRHLSLRDEVGVKDEEKSLLLSFMGISQLVLNKRRVTIDLYQKGILQRYLNLPPPEKDVDLSVKSVPNRVSNGTSAVNDSSPIKPKHKVFPEDDEGEGDNSVIDILDKDREDDDSRYLHVQASRSGSNKRPRSKISKTDKAPTSQLHFVDSSEDSDVEIVEKTDKQAGTRGTREQSKQTKKSQPERPVKKQRRESNEQRNSRLILRMSTSPAYKKQKVEVALEKPEIATAATPAISPATTQITQQPNHPPNKPPKKDKAVKQQEKYTKLQRKAKKQAVASGGPEENIFLDVKAMLGESVVDELIKSDQCLDGGFEFAIVPENNWVIAVPFCLPGEKVLARVYRNSFCHSYADLVSVLDKRESWRDESNIRCKYFGSCSGCQYQMIPYQRQLLLKQRVVEKAYQRFSQLPSPAIPTILPTIASPKQYNYRTKITPHFQAAPKSAGNDFNPDIGFDMKGRRVTLDIEECPIATETLNVGMQPARAKVKETIKSYKRGATLLLRDSMTRPENAADATKTDIPPADMSTINHDDRECITDHKRITREIVGDKLFEFTAGSFFQNNSSILVPLTQYVLDALPEKGEEPMYLVDTYCGAGLFSICLHERFDKVAGIEISQQSIQYAKHNVKLNGLDENKISFRVGKSEAIFDVVGDLPPANTSVIIDPPRKGCDDAFITQLKDFKPHRVVYVSCNVHTQARDVGKLCGDDGPYSIESLRGFDLFPQTSHVEGVAVLKLK